MPRFDEEGFNPRKRIENDSLDRTVPTDDFDDDILNEYMSNFQRTGSQSSAKISPYASAQHKTGKSSNKPNPKKIVKKIGLSLVALFLVLVVLVGSIGNSYIDKIYNKMTIDDYRYNEYVDYGDLKSSNNVYNILLLGMDARPNQATENTRSDSMMIVSFDKTHKCIKMVSFLRDTWVYIPCKDKYQRLNACGSYNDLVDTIEYNFGVDIDGYVVTDFKMFKVLVDAVGGVEIDVTEKEAKEVNSHPKRYNKAKLEAGRHKLTGEQALAYCRIRKIDTDFYRAKRQRTVMTAILAKLTSSSPVSLLKAANECAGCLETNLSKKMVIKTGLAALKCMENGMYDTRVPFDDTWYYDNIGGASVIAIDSEQNKEKLINYIYKTSAEQLKEEKESKQKNK